MLIMYVLFVLSSGRTSIYLRVSIKLSKTHLCRQCSAKGLKIPYKKNLQIPKKKEKKGNVLLPSFRPRINSLITNSLVI